MFLTDTLGSVIETNSASMQGNSFFSTKHAPPVASPFHS